MRKIPERMVVVYLDVGLIGYVKLFLSPRKSERNIMG